MYVNFTLDCWGGQGSHDAFLGPKTIEINDKILLSSKQGPCYNLSANSEKNIETTLYFDFIYQCVNGNKRIESQNIWVKEHTNKLSNCLSASESKVIEYVNCLIKRRMMSFSAISLITLKSFNGEIK